MARKGGYTIWIFRGTFQPYKISLPRGLTKVLSVVVGIVVLLFPIVTYRCVTQHIQLAGLERERSQQADRVALLDKKFSEIQQQMRRLREFDAKLRVIASLENPEEGDALLGVGGLEPGYAGMRRGSEDDQSVMGSEADRLYAEVKIRERSFQELFASLQGKRAQLACTPSVHPAHGWLTSRFGYRRDPFTGLRQFHEGIDISNRTGTPIIAPADGVVSRIRQEYGLGVVLTIDHGHGIATRYGHLARVQMTVGQRVKRGQVIAAMGNTGRSTGPHVHYEVRLNGAPVNPEHYIFN